MCVCVSTVWLVAVNECTVQGVLTMEQMKSHLSAETPKSAELMLKHGVISEEEFEALGIPLRALTPGFRTVRERRDAAKAAREVRSIYLIRSC